MEEVRDKSCWGKTRTKGPEVRACTDSWLATEAQYCCSSRRKGADHQEDQTDQRVKAVMEGLEAVRLGRFQLCLQQREASGRVFSKGDEI